MATSYLLAPIPQWVIINKQGLTAGGAVMYTYSSLNQSQEKAVYRDPAGAEAWTNPIVFNANGTQGPFYWKVDSGNLNDTYYIVVYDSSGNLLWEQNNFFPPGSGGGGSATTNIPAKNLIANNVFLNHVDNIANPITQQNILIAPSNHRGFTPALINPIVGLYGIVGPDIWFTKNNLNASDSISFVDFTVSNGPFNNDNTPTQYVNYVCTNIGAAGESYKCFQFPICQKVKNLANQIVTFNIWGSCGTGTQTINIYARQYFGSGGTPSPDSRSIAVPLVLTTTWQQIPVSFTVPSIATKTIGTTNDDALYIQIDMPLNQTCDIRFTKPALYYGSINPSSDFETYDQTDSVDQTPRVGQVITSLQSQAPLGWLKMNDGTIGSSSSGATVRSNNDTFQLYKTIYDGVSDTYAPVIGGRTTSAVDDFVLNKPLTLTKALGRVLAGINADFGTSINSTGIDYVNNQITVSASTPNPLTTGTPILLSANGTLPTGLATNTVYYVIFVSTSLGVTTIKLAQSVDRAQSSTALPFGTAGTGTIFTLLPTLGASLGEGVHQLTVNELANHTHNITGNTGTITGPHVTINANTAAGTTTEAQGNDFPHNTMQPTTLMNIFIKY